MELNPKKDHFKFTVIVLSFVLAISLSVTIVLAVFTANKSGSVTLNFAEGLTMVLSPYGTSGRIVMTGGGADEYTFTYPPQTNVQGILRYDGVKATLNKAAWVSVKIELKEVINNSETVLNGRWTKNADGDHYFYPSGEKTNWTFIIRPDKNLFSSTYGSTSVLTSTGISLWANVNEANTLWTGWVIRAIDHYTNGNYLNDLAGRQLKVYFTVKAKTDSAPTF